jgi:hypothetical protein
MSQVSRRNWRRKPEVSVLLNNKNKQWISQNKQRANQRQRDRRKYIREATTRNYREICLKIRQEIARDLRGKHVQDTGDI